MGAFQIEFASLHFPRQNVDDESFLLLSAKSSFLLRALHLTFQEKLTAAVDAEQTAELLHESIFCCCLPEGMAMLRCKADAFTRAADLDGFLIPNTSLRTAWMISRWKLLFVCAAGWEKHGIVRLSPAEIEQIAMTLRVSRQRQARLMEMSQKMLASPVPFSFAVTDHPLGQIPVCFSEQSGSAALADTKSGIPFSAEAAMHLSSKLGEHDPAYKTLRLCNSSKKAYLSQRQKEPDADRTALREEVSAYPDDLWYFTVQVTASRWFTRLLSLQQCEQLTRGSVDFSEICEESDAFLCDARNFAKSLADASHAQAPAPDKPRGGLLRSLFRK